MTNNRTRAFGTHDVARVCHVTPPTVGRWIEEGILPSFTTGGGHRRVWDADLVIFLKAHNMPVPAELEAPLAMRILVVDDEERVRGLLVRVIKRVCPEAEIHEAEDGFDAGRKIESLLPFLVILDLRLPGVDGLKVCESVKKDERLKAVKILCITGFEIEKSRADVAAAGGDGFLAKPFKPEALAEQLRKMLPEAASVQRPAA